MLRLPLWRLWPGFRKSIWFSSGQSVCSGCGSESISCVVESEFRIVTCDPRVTVSAIGQTWLFWRTNVFGIELGVHDPVGLVVLDGELLPHAITSAITAASAAPPTHLASLCIPVSPRSP